MFKLEVLKLNETRIQWNVSSVNQLIHGLIITDTEQLYICVTVITSIGKNVNFPTKEFGKRFIVLYNTERHSVRKKDAYVVQTWLRESWSFWGTAAVYVIVGVDVA